MGFLVLERGPVALCMVHVVRGGVTQVLQVGGEGHRAPRFRGGPSGPGVELLVVWWAADSGHAVLLRSLLVHV